MTVPVDVDNAALARFRAEYGTSGDGAGDVALPPVAVVIAAYNEATNIGQVIDAVPREVCGLPVSVVVVDDGSSDDTAAVVRGHGGYAVEPLVNRGQGAALRLGYRAAREGGARFIATTDADGQYDASELPLIVGPLVEGTADFVSGSRRLGRAETHDRVRLAGVRFYAGMIGVLTRTPITDPANGFRAMTAKVTEQVTLEQPQYQATELLIGAIYRGFRVTERATTMRERHSGGSKKGNNLLYGYRFGKVIVSTWWREARRARRDGGRLGAPTTRTRTPA